MTTQTPRIVVGYDGSKESLIALDWAAATARRTDAPLHLVHALPLDLIPGVMAADSFNWVTAVEQSADEVLEEGMERARAMLGDDGVTGERVLDSAGYALVRAAHDASLVVTGTRGRGAIASAALGSTAYAVASHATCPAVVVRAAAHADTAPQPGPEGRVVVGVDGSECADRALDAAAAVADETGARLTIVRVEVPVAASTWGYSLGPGFDAHLAQEMEAYGESVVAAARDRVARAHPDLVVDTQQLWGLPGHLLANVPAGAALVVVGSRGRGGFAGLLLGSVSHSLIHEARCPVMIVH